MSQERRLSITRTRILRLLGEYKQLLTRDIWREVAPQTPLLVIQKNLIRLRKLEMVNSFPARPELGNSELYWQLLRGGAVAVGQSYGNEYYRTPSFALLEYRGLQLEFTRTVRLAGWQVVKPRHYGAGNPLPNPTRQYEILEYALGLIEYQRMQEVERREGRVSHQRQLDYQAKLYRLGLSTRTNDYVAYTDTSAGFRSVVFVVAKAKTGEQFWKNRVREYRLVARSVPVVAVFESREEQVGWEAKLKEGGLKTVLLGEVREYLAGIAGRKPGG